MKIGGRGAGKMYRTCRSCRAQRWVEKYHSDETFRERAKKRGIEYYHRKKQRGLDKVP